MARSIHVLCCLLSMMLVLGFVLGPICIGLGFYFDRQFYRNPIFPFLAAWSLAYVLDQMVFEYYARRTDLSYENVDVYVEKILERTSGYYLSPAKVYEYDRKRYKERLIAVIESRGKNK